MAKVLHASGSGYFPFCLTEGTPQETGLGTNYPISLPLTKYMSWWWKVKTWDLTGSSACNETATQPQGRQLVNNWTTTSLVQDDTYTADVSTPQSLVCYVRRVIKRASNNDEEGVGFNGFSAGTFNDGAFTNLWVITFRNHAYIDGSTIYPKMDVTGWYDSLSPGDIKVQEQLDPLSSFRIDGVTIPCYIKWFPNWTQYSNWSITGSQSFDLNPKTYWDYS